MINPQIPNIEIHCTKCGAPVIPHETERQLADDWWEYICKKFPSLTFTGRLDFWKTLYRESKEDIRCFYIQQKLDERTEKINKAKNWYYKKKDKK